MLRVLRRHQMDADFHLERGKFRVGATKRVGTIK